MSNKKTILSLIIILVILVLIAGYFGFSKNSSVKDDLAKSGVSVSSVVNLNNNVASVSGALSRDFEIKWNSQSYPENVGVDINLLRKVADSPVSYELVKRIFVNTSNDGVEKWTSEDAGDSLYVEVVCSQESTFVEGCVAGEPMKL